MCVHVLCVFEHHVLYKCVCTCICVLVHSSPCVHVCAHVCVHVCACDNEQDHCNGEGERGVWGERTRGVAFRMYRYDTLGPTNRRSVVNNHGNHYLLSSSVGGFGSNMLWAWQWCAGVACLGPAVVHQLVLLEHKVATTPGLEARAPFLEKVPTDLNWPVERK